MTSESKLAVLDEPSSGDEEGHVREQERTPFEGIHVQVFRIINCEGEPSTHLVQRLHDCAHCRCAHVA